MPPLSCDNNLEAGIRKPQILGLGMLVSWMQETLERVDEKLPPAFRILWFWWVISIPRTPSESNHPSCLPVTYLGKKSHYRSFQRGLWDHPVQPFIYSQKLKARERKLPAQGQLPWIQARAICPGSHCGALANSDWMMPPPNNYSGSLSMIRRGKLRGHPSSLQTWKGSREVPMVQPAHTWYQASGAQGNTVT